MLASHTYAEEGTVSLSVQVLDVGGASTGGSVTISVADAALGGLSINSPSATEAMGFSSFTIATFTKSSFDKGLKDLRDKRMLTFNSEKITRVTLNATEFGKSGPTDWQILKPKPLRADGAQVDELVRKLKEAKIDTGISDDDTKKAQTAFAAGAKVGDFTLASPDGTVVAKAPIVALQAVPAGGLWTRMTDHIALWFK